jgi:type VI secretion system secreted protein VgrG
VTNTGSTTIITGNVGVTPGTAITPGTPGFTFAGAPAGTTHSADGLAQQARIDAFTGTAPASAFNFLQVRTGGINLTGQDLGTVGPLTPGLYHFDSSAQLTGSLILDDQGINNAVFIFQIGSTLTTASGSSVLLAGTGTGDGVFWQVGSSATLGTTTAFAGNILAAAAITMNTGATISCGSALARDAAVTMDTNTIATGCGGGFTSSGSTFKLISPTGGGGTITAFEPSSLLLTGAALMGIVAWRRRAGR